MANAATGMNAIMYKSTHLRKQLRYTRLLFVYVSLMCHTYIGDEKNDEMNLRLNTSSSMNEYQNINFLFMSCI